MKNKKEKLEKLSVEELIRLFDYYTNTFNILCKGKIHYNNQINFKDFPKLCIRGYKGESLRKLGFINDFEQFIANELMLIIEILNEKKELDKLDLFYNKKDNVFDSSIDERDVISFIVKREYKDYARSIIADLKSIYYPKIMKSNLDFLEKHKDL